MKATDVVIIGAGPIGIEMACALRRANVSYQQFEAGSLAATIAWYAPGTQIFSSPERIAIAGYPFSVYPQPKATREDYLQYLREVVHAEKLQIEFNRKIQAITKTGDLFSLKVTASSHGVGGSEENDKATTEQKVIETVAAKNIIFAIGNMHAGNKLGIPGENLPHVSHYFNDPHQYFGNKIVIVGAKNSAAEAAVRLVRTHVAVTVVTRGEGFEQARIKPWLYPELLSFMREGRLTVISNAQLTDIQESTVSIQSQTGPTSVVADKVLLLTGYRQDSSLLQQIGVTLQRENRAPTFDNETMQTNVAGAFVIGTACAGTERGQVTSYIETSHVHIPKVMKGLGLHAHAEINNKKLRDEETVET